MSNATAAHVRRARITLLVATLAAAVSGSAGARPPATPSSVMVSFENSESAVWDERTGAWYVSNSRIGRSGGGNIVKLVPPALVPEVFAAGLGGSPQGLAIHGTTMYAAVGSNLRVIDMLNPTSQYSIPVVGSSDIAVDPSNGDLYVTHLSGNVVRRVREGTVSPFASIGSPDGITFLDGGLYIAALRPTSNDSGIYRIDVQTKQITTVAAMPNAALDGLERDGDAWLTTDFARGHVWRVPDGGQPELIAQLAPGSADLGLDPATRTIAVPNLAAGPVVFMTL